MDQGEVKKRSSRILTFDILRGYFLIVILFNHLFYFPSGLEIFTGRGELYVSSAEGFFLISGIILGIVRGRKLIEKPFSMVTKLLLKRSVQLYISAVILAVLFTVIGWQFMSNPGLKMPIMDPSTPLWKLVWDSLTLQYLYGWADFLRQYALFIALAPLAMWWLRNGQWLLVLFTSFLVWLLFPYTTHDYMAQPFSWQLIFFWGLVIGFHWDAIATWWRNTFSATVRHGIGVTLVCVTAITAIGSAMLVFADDYSGAFWTQMTQLHELIGEYFDKDRLPIARLILGTIWFFALFWLVRKYEESIAKKLGWLLIILGQNSLYVYIIQAFIVFFFHLFILMPQMDTSQNASWYINLFVSLVALALVWLPTKKQLLFKIIPR